jgi:hypothetical protein
MPRASMCEVGLRDLVCDSAGQARLRALDVPDRPLARPVVSSLAHYLNPKTANASPLLQS